MSMGINAKQDMSFLFSGLSSQKGAVGGMNNFLGDYASIKNGSYGKLMKAYYGTTSASKEVSSIASKNQSTATDAEKKSLAKVQTSSDELKDAADKLLSTGKNSVFNKVSTEGNAEKTYDKDSIYSAVSSFVNKYNDALKAASDSGTKSVASRVDSMAGNAIANARALSSVGISINEDSTLKIDKDSFMKADMAKVQSLFQGAGSFGYQASAQASMMNFAAENAANKQANYTASGTYFNADAGALFNTYF